MPGNFPIANAQSLQSPVRPYSPPGPPGILASLRATVFVSEGSQKSQLLRPVVKIVWTAWSPGEGQGKQGSARRPRGLEIARRALPPSYSRVPGPPSSPSAGLPLDSMAVHKTTLTTGLLIAFYKDLWGPMDTQEDLGGPRRSSSWLFLAPRRSQEDPGKARDGQEGPGRALELLGAPRGSWLPWLPAPPGSSWLLLAPLGSRETSWLPGFHGFLAPSPGSS